MAHTRKKLLLREDEAEVIEFALDKIAGGFEAAGKEYSDMQIVALSAADKKRWEISEEVASKAAAEARRILKLVQDAEVTETEAEL